MKILLFLNKGLAVLNDNNKDSLPVPMDCTGVRVLAVCTWVVNRVVLTYFQFHVFPTSGSNPSLNKLTAKK